MSETNEIMAAGAPVGASVAIQVGTQEPNSGPEPGLENAFNRFQLAALLAEFRALEARILAAVEKAAAV